MKVLLFTLALLGALPLLAHQGEISSTLLVERADGSWELHVVTALTAFQYEIQTHYGEDAYVSPEAFEELVTDHLKKTVAVRFNGGAAANLTPLRVQLGHETQVAFALSGVPEEVTGIEVTNTAFTDIHHNKSTLVVLKTGSEKQQFELNANNRHTATLAFETSTLLRADTAEATVPPVGVALLGIVVLAGLALAWFRTTTA